MMFDLEDKMNINEKFSELIDQFYTIEKIVNDLEKTPRSYGTEQKYYSNETHTLKMIAEHEGINQKELSEKMYRTKGATSVMIEKLLKKGLIEKRISDVDSRSHCLYLTEKGKEINECHMQHDTEVLKIWLEDAHFTENELDTATDVLIRCINYYMVKIYGGKRLKY